MGWLPSVVLTFAVDDSALFAQLEEHQRLIEMTHQGLLGTEHQRLIAMTHDGMLVTEQ